MTFTIEQIRKYLQSQDSFGDCLYFLSEANIVKANAVLDDEQEDEEKYQDPFEFDEIEY